MKPAVQSPEGSAPGPRGFALGPVLILGLVCLVLVFTIAAISTFQLNASNKTQSSEQALYLAEGALAETLSALHDGMQTGNQPFGRHQETVRYAPFTTRPGAIGLVSFDPAATWGYSTNNYDGTQATGWDNTPVPQGYVHVLARGTVGPSTRTVEAFVNIPDYTYVLSVDGPLKTTSALDVLAETSMGTLVAHAQQGTVGNNHSGANVGSNTSIQAGVNSLVTGDVVCIDKASVSLASPSVVDGVVRQASVTVPKLQVTVFNTQGPTTPPLPPPNGQHIVDVAQNTYNAGDVIINGDLQLDGATVYVAGNLHVTGGLTGAGAVIANGNVQVDTGADLDASTMVALLATGDVTLNGPTSLKKYFQGLVYTEGAFSASNITIAGAFISSTGPDATGSGSSLTLGPGVTVVGIPAATTITGGPVTPLSLMSAGGRTYLNQPVNGGIWNQPNPTPTGVPWCPMVALQDNAIDTAIYNAVNTQAPFNGNHGTANWLQTSPTVISGELGYNTSVPVIWIGGTSSSPTPPWPAYSMNYCSIQYDPQTNRFVPLNPPQMACSVQTGPTDPGRPVSYQQMDAMTQAVHGQTLAWYIAFFQQAQRVYMNTANGLITNPPPCLPGLGKASVPNLSLNQFLSDTTPLHIVSWRER